MTSIALGLQDPTGVHSRHAFLFLARELALAARSGQAGTLVRTVAGAAVDDHGTSIATPHTMPSWTRVDTDADTVRDRVGLHLADDLLSWPFQPTPGALTGLLEFVEAGTAATVDAGLLYLGNDGVTGARLALRSTGTLYELAHHNGTTEEVSTLAAGPSAGDLVRLFFTVAATGAPQLAQQINGGAWSVAAAGGVNTFAASWGAAAAKLRFNSVGTADLGEMIALGCVLDLGIQARTGLLRALEWG